MRFLFLCSMLLLGTVKAQFPYLNNKTRDFLVNGSAIPNVTWDIGESYAGYLAKDVVESTSLYFWFFPSSNPKASDEITIWLNGGPGCSSLMGLMLENGPFLWQPGTYQPVPNPFSWTNLTNVIYVDQPGGTGFSLGPSSVVSEFDVARQFMSFWRRFIKTFDLQGRKIYLTGESYAGQYIPYIASAMLDKKDETYFNVAGVQINDPYINEMNILRDVPALAAVNHHTSLFPFNNTFKTALTTLADDCGYTSLLHASLQYPQNARLPPVPTDPGCSIHTLVTTAISEINPCFNPYHILSSCPTPWNPVGGPIVGAGPTNYFNRSDVQKAINAYPTDFFVCKTGIFPTPNGLDTSPPSSLGPLASVIERTNNTIIAHGSLDFELLVNGTLMSIQNMTWNGRQGFERRPTEGLFVPYRAGAGGGTLGTAHTERGLTFSEVFMSGHEIPQYVPGAAYRQLEFLLGRIDSLSKEAKDFTA
ncbi:serine-type carboxypeptidase F [Aspergillus heteromorphus CBS 117.55]|uniref:Carboxypeptidase n=1 Tax=Aspergillus heteromorphus CBS 117.55 TaxID=1448321 RepID=A0A317VM64_9EURO|nr:serine-type carboxypeptidase F [Aspergillus heteromorphus CBS 117.55]PWY75446.1 serine-type carboxypeptidase F [Aspergillus heteromorphus CBS 117.55]